jgi:hypothetical protein
MARVFLTPIDLGKLELQNPRLQQLGSDPGSAVEGQFYYNTGTKTLRFYNGTAWIDLGRHDQISQPTADVAWNSKRITGVLDPSSAQDVATKNYVDGLQQGISWKTSVRGATAAAGTLATSFANGQTIDTNVTLVTGDRILIKNQATQTENGIYTVNASGAPTRATDADTGAEIKQAAVFVQEGTANADTAWVCNVNGTINIGSTNIIFVQFGSGITYTGSSGVDVTGSVISIENSGVLLVTHGGLGVASPTDHAVLVGSGATAVTPITVGATGEVLRGQTGADPVFGAVVLSTDVTGTLGTSNGGTGGNSVANAKTSLGFMTRYAASYGDGAQTSYTITHNLNTLDVIARVFRNSDGVEVEVDITHTGVNALTVAHAAIPTTNQYRIVVIG